METPDPVGHLVVPAPVASPVSVERRASRAGMGSLESPAPRDLPASEALLACPASRGPRVTVDSLDWMEPREASADLVPRERTDHQALWDLLDLWVPLGPEEREEGMDPPDLLASEVLMEPWGHLETLDLSERLEELECLESPELKETAALQVPRVAQGFRDLVVSQASLGSLATPE